MSNDNNDFDQEYEEEEVIATNEKDSKFDKIISEEGSKKYKLTGMFKEWFLDYASYVILERAVPHIIDGLKPVQRRILHAMKLNEDGRLNKVATLVGATMPFHPHGDASIKDALVQLGQKDLLIECQGNWGNIITGDSAAAGRYIEARLTPFANEVVFNSKTTEWTKSYDGRNLEPVNLPIKFPLLLAQGSEGIAVGLSCRILPHNFNELIDASIAYLNGEEFEIYPDFPTGGMIDVTNYNKGKRDGRVRIRAKIEKTGRNSLVINEIPYSKTTSDIIDSILKASDKGKIRIRKIDDNTAEHAEILITLPNDVSPDKTIDALYACTDCEISISPNCCVIMDKKPHFIGVDDVLKFNTENTERLLAKELEIKIGELGEDWHYTSLEKIFFENKIYKILENDAASWESQIAEVFEEMLKYQSQLHKEITEEDILKLVEKPVRKISKFDIKAATDRLHRIEDEIARLQNDLTNIVRYTIEYYTGLKKKYGERFPRKTEITSFENIMVNNVVANNAKLYVNKEEGFIGYSQKKIENAEYICECSDISDIIVFLKDGRYIVTKISDKSFIEKGIIHLAVFNKADDRTIYNVIYRDGKNGTYYAKRFSITSITKDKWYDITMGKEGSAIQWFSSNANGEAEVVKIQLRHKPKLKKTNFEFDFANLAIRNKGSMGNIVTKNPIQRISLKSSGVSTLEERQLWFDWDIFRLNDEERGELLGEFKGDEHILVICKDGTYYTTNLDLSNRYPGDILKVETLDDKVYTAIYWDEEIQSHYIKRFRFEISENTPISFISESKGSRLIGISDDRYPQVKLTFDLTGKRSKVSEELIDAEAFIGVKGFRAKGKKASYQSVETIGFIEPLEKEEEEPLQPEAEAQPEETEAETAQTPSADGQESTVVDFDEGEEDNIEEPTLF